MKAIRIHEHGGPEVLRVDEIEKPQPRADEVLVQVKAAAMNRLDMWVRKGIPGVPLPVIMGSDGAGIIEAVGEIAEESSAWKTGDEVFAVPFRTCGICSACLSGSEELCRNYQIRGEHFDGMQAEYVALPADAVMRKPATLNWEQAAAFPLASQTAYHMLVKKAGISPFHTVLIWGGTSGIGSAAIQIAKAFGAQVIATAGDEKKVRQAKDLGADHVLNYHDVDVGKSVRELTNGAGVEIVFEHTGLASWKHSQKALKVGGTIVTCGATTGPKIELDLRHVFMKHQRIIGSTMGNRADLDELCRLIDSGRFKPLVDKVFTADQVRAAHEYLDAGKQSGKIVITF